MYDIHIFFLDWSVTVSGHLVDPVFAADGLVNFKIVEESINATEY